MSEYILEISHVSKYFQGLVAINDLSMKVKKGQIYGIIGPNGAGKTTLFNCITGIYRPEIGQILWKGQDIKGISPYKIAELGILRTFQTIRLFAEMSVAENIMSGRHIKSKQRWYNGVIPTPAYYRDEKANWEKVGELMEFFNLTEYATIPAGDLSYGIQRRIEMARALAAEPELLILDEPTTHLDEENKIHANSQDGKADKFNDFGD